MQLRRTSAGLVAALVAGAACLASAGLAPAFDASEGLSSAEERASSAESQIAKAEAKLGPARQRYANAAKRASRAESKAEAAAGQADEVEAALVQRREAAAERLTSIEANYTTSVDEHDEEVENGWALALAALVIVAIALTWGWFRASAPVTWLVDLSLGRAIGLCIGGGIALIVAGAGIASAGGVLGVLGTWIMILGLVLPVAFLLARHSVQVQRGKEKPLFRRKRLPGWMAWVIAGLALLLFAGSLSDGALSGEPEEPIVPEKLREEAKLAEGDPADPATAELVRALARAEQLEQQAAGAADPRDEAGQALSEVRRQLRDGRRQLARANRKARLYTRRLAAIVRREAREAAAAAAREAREIEQAEIEAEAELPPVASESYENCDSAPSNIPVPPGSPLDGDGDGIGCES